MKSTSIGQFTPEAILNDLIDTNEISRMREHLRDMLDYYLLSQDESILRQRVYATWFALDIMLDRTEKLTRKERRAA